MEYIKSLNKVITIGIDNDSDLILKDGEFYLEVDVVYELIRGKVEVNSYKEFIGVKDNSYYYDYTNNSNVILEMVANDNIVVNNEIIYDKGDKIVNVKTNEKGKYIINNVYLGSYCLVDKNNNSSCFDVIDERVVNVDIKESLKKDVKNCH